MTSWDQSGRLDPRQLVDLYTDLGREIRAHADTHGALGAVTRVAVQTVPGASYASITRRGHDATYLTMSATHDAAAIADQMQYDLESGPCIDAIAKRDVVVTGNLEIDPRWAVYGPQAVAAAGVHSVLAVALMFDDDSLVAALNIYSTDIDAFGDDAVTIASLLASHGALAAAHVIAREKIRNLEIAIRTNREIGMAMGVLMSAFKVSSEVSFDMLRIASQRTHRKLFDVAREVITTGTLELPRRDEA